MKISIVKYGKQEEIELQKMIDISDIKVKTVKKYEKEYIKFPLSFDTETSHMVVNDEEVGWIYQWAFTIYNQVVVGRTPSEFCRQLRILYDFLELSEDRRLVCYAHNLSYDIVYLMKFLIEEFGEPKILAVKPHKFVTVIFTGLEFRCSYMLSNMSLELWAKKLDSPIKKLVGAVDYDIVRFQDTELSETDWQYQIQDILALQECLRIEMLHENDTVATIPLTSTGYVRRDCRIAVSHDKNYRKMFTKTALVVKTYKLCKQAFGGGDVHGNRFMRGKVINRKIGHCDYKSHYPSRQQLDYFPISKFVKFYDYTCGKILDKMRFIQLCKEYCVLATIQFENLKLKEGVTAPTLSESKLSGDYISVLENGVKGTDNGRIINMKGKGLFTGTELDYRWIFRQYTWDSLAILEVYISEKGQYPLQLRECINKYFTYKESLEGGILRDKSKNKLNAIYGMTATDIVREENVLDFDSMKFTTLHCEDEEIEEKLGKYYKSRNSFMPFQFGVWTTAHARDELHKMIELIGYDNFIYCDTDSIFFLDSDEVREKINTYNEKAIEKAMSDENLHVKNVKGKFSCYGVFEDEKDGIEQFKFLHAKCYAFVNESGLHATIAGVAKSNKKLGNEKVTIEEELETIDNLREGFTFIECGSTKSKYVNYDISRETICEHLTEYASAVIITPTTKELGNCIEDLYEWEVE